MRLRFFLPACWNYQKKTQGNHSVHRCLRHSTLSSFSRISLCKAHLIGTLPSNKKIYCQVTILKKAEHPDRISDSLILPPIAKHPFPWLHLFGFFRGFRCQGVHKTPGGLCRERRYQGGEQGHLQACIWRFWAPKCSLKIHPYTGCAAFWAEEASFTLCWHWWLSHPRDANRTWEMPRITGKHPNKFIG